MSWSLLKSSPHSCCTAPAPLCPGQVLGRDQLASVLWDPGGVPSRFCHKRISPGGRNSLVKGIEVGKRGEGMVLFGPMTWQKLNRATGQPLCGTGDRCLCKTGNSLNSYGTTRHRKPDAQTEPTFSRCRPPRPDKGRNASAEQQVESNYISIKLRKEKKARRLFINVRTYIALFMELGKTACSHQTAACGGREGSQQQSCYHACCGCVPRAVPSTFRLPVMSATLQKGRLRLWDPARALGAQDEQHSHVPLTPELALLSAGWKCFS